MNSNHLGLGLGLLLLILLASSCHSYRYVPYEVKNRSHGDILAEGVEVNQVLESRRSKSHFKPDTLYRIAPKQSQTVFVYRYYCLFGNCKPYLAEHIVVDSIRIYKALPHGKESVPVRKEDWTFKKKKAILSIR